MAKATLNEAWITMGQPGDDRPGIGRRLVGRTGKALVMVRSEERLEAGRFGMLRDGQLVGVAHPLLGLDHERKPHRLDPPVPLDHSV